VHLILHRRRIGQMIAGLARPPQSAAPPAGRSQDPAEGVAAMAAGPEPRRMRVTRRRFLIGFGALLAGFAGVFVAVEALFRGGGAPRTAAGGAIPGVASFPALNIEQTPHVPAEQWVVTVDGLVDKPLRLDHAAWSALTRHAETADFHCVEGWTVDRLRWGGVAPRTLLDMAGIQPSATHVNFHALGGSYADSLPLGLVDDTQTVLADTLDEQPLPDTHGGPLRLVVPKQLGYKNVKWVVRLEVTDHEVTGYWERNGYPMDAPVPSV
jgi:DMSO/TMAO reductase YedYZ molybdopterin-dependent catalytic subunit